jgi:hypothetical protein
MTLHKLLNTEKYTPINEFAIEIALINSNFGKISENLYIYLTEHNDLTLITQPNGPFISAFLWACDESAAMRIYNHCFEDDKNIQIEPPIELLPKNSGPTYKEILKNIKHVGIMESASYRIATDGAYVYKSIRSKYACYYFRNRKTDNNETPFAIQWKMQGPIPTP